MALNPPLIVGGMPMGIIGESFACMRRSMELDLAEEAASGFKTKGVKGTLYLTTVRMCFVADKPASAGFAAIDIPLQGTTEEDAEQPIFGANRLVGAVAPVPGKGFHSKLKFKLYFMSGGCTVFWRCFFRIMEQYRINDERAREALFSNAVATQSMISSMSTAYVDPSDPSVIFITQPAEVMAPGIQRLPPTTLSYHPMAMPMPPAAAGAAGPGGYAPAPAPGVPVPAAAAHGPGGAYYGGPAPMMVPPPSAATMMMPPPGAPGAPVYGSAAPMPMAPLPPGYAPVAPVAYGVPVGAGGVPMTGPPPGTAGYVALPPQSQAYGYPYPQQQQGQQGQVAAHTVGSGVAAEMVRMF